MFGSKIKLDKELFHRCKEYAKEEGYTNVEEFIIHTLEKELRNKRKESDETDERVIERLKGLGYIS